MDILAFWKAVLAQDAEALATYFHPDATVAWHCSNERFTVAEYIRANCEYPGDWAGEIERVEKMGDLIVTAVRVYPADRTTSFHVTSFMHLRDGKILALDEYWGDDGPAPVWRQKMGIGRPLRDG